MSKTSAFSAVAFSMFAASAIGCVTGADAPGATEMVEGALCTPTALARTNAVASASPKQAAKNAIDGNTGTRWESAYSDPQWIYVDLGVVKMITEVKIDWQHAAAKDYHVDVSNDAATWTTVASKTGLPPVDHRIDDLTGFSVSARYVRVYGTARATVYGYSIWELNVYDGSSCSTGAAGSTTGAAGAAGSTTGAAGAAGAAGSCASASLTTPASPVAASPSPKQAAKNAVDGNTGTRWESAYSDPQWIYVDLGAAKTITEVRIDWQHAAAKDYHVDVSNDAATWTTVASKTGLLAVDHRIDDLTGLGASGRYVRVYGTARATVYGYSIWELNVYGYDAASCASNLLTAGWDRSNVFANFTPASGWTFGSGKNAISFDYTAPAYSTPTQPPLVEFTQSVTVPQAGSSWELRLTFANVVNQSTAPPQFLVALGGAGPSSPYKPTEVQLASSGGQLVHAGSLTSGNVLTADFSVSLTAGQTVDVTIDNAPTIASGKSTQKFDVVDATLVRLN